jgi:transcriptional regulator with XRE-family HTH domain
MNRRRYKLIRYYTELGSYLQARRLHAGLTQRDVQLKLGYSSAQFISNFERGISAPPLSKLKVLAKLYRLNLDKVIELILAGEEKNILEELGK